MTHRHIGHRRWSIGSASMLALLWATPGLAAAPALPTGGQVSAGAASLSQTASRLTINQASNRAVIDWKSFNVGAGNQVVFNNGSGATLNRVTGPGAANIAGAVSATGSVYLLDPAGVIVSPSGRISVGGSFVASTLGVGNDAFMAGGSLQLAGHGGSVVNLGAITAANGDIVLTGADVRNEGALSAPRGEAALVSGSTVEIGDGPMASGRIRATAGDATDTTQNSGQIAAAQIELRSHAGNVMALAVATGGLIEATGVKEADGNIYLVSDQGTTTVRGDVRAHAGSRGGGLVETSGAHVDFAGARISGKTWLIDPDSLDVDAASATTIVNTLDGLPSGQPTSVTLLTGVAGSSGPGVVNPNGLGDINILAPISWGSASTLNLDSYHSVNIHAPVTVRGGGALVIFTNDGGQGGVLDFGLHANGFAGSVQFTGGSSSGAFLAINDVTYALLYAMPDFNLISASAGANYALATPIDASGAGTYQGPVVGGTFSGAFTGLGNTISNLSITAPTIDNVGLFSKVSGSVSDIGLIGGGVAGHGRVGPLIGDLQGGSVSSAYSTSIVTGGDSQGIGGLVGGVDNAGSLTHVFATGPVRGSTSSQELGGLAGYVDGSVSDAFATGPVTSGPSSRWLGGLVGLLYGSASHVSATGGVTSAGNEVGGLVGRAETLATISNAYSTGPVIGGAYSGGLVGNAIAGSSASNSYWDVTYAGLQTSALGTGLTTAQLQGSLPAGFDSTAWGTGAGLIPYLKSFYPTTPQAVSGLALKADSTAAAGGYVQLYAGGSAVTGFVSVGANGKFYTLLPNGTLNAGASPIGVTLRLDDSSPLSAAEFISQYAPFPAVGLYGNLLVQSGIVTEYTQTTSLSALQTQLQSTFDATGYSELTSTLLAQALHIQASGGFSIDTEFVNNGPVRIVAAGDGITISPTGFLGSAASGDAILLAAYGNFTDQSSNQGAELSAPNGRWLIYTHLSPQASFGTTNTFGGLVGKNFYGDPYNFGTLSFATAPHAGNRFVVDAQPTLTVTADSAIPTYTAAPQGVTTYHLTGLINGDLAADAFQQSTPSATTGVNVGTYSIQPGVGVSDLNYAIAYANGVMRITPATLTLSVVDSTKTYDGTRIATTAPTVTGLLGSDTVTGATELFDTASVGTQKAITIGPTPTVNDGNNGNNYTIAIGRASGSGAIQPRAVIITGSRAYDNTTNAPASVLTVANAVNGDNVGLTGTGLVSGVTPGTYALAGTDVGLTGLSINNPNYTIVGSTGTLAITPAPLVISATPDSKVYDGTVFSGAKPSATGLIGSDSISNLAQAFGAKSAGSQPLTVLHSYKVSDGNGGRNYSVVTVDAAGTITPAPLTVSLSGTVSKTYDGTTLASVNPANITLTGVIGSDVVTARGASLGVFADKNVGTAKTVTVTGLSLAGADSGNYQLSGQPSANIGIITPASLSLTAVGASKTYDGTVTAGATPSITGLVKGDSITGLGEVFDQKSAGTRTLSVAPGFVINDGAKGANYVVATATASGTISPANLAIALQGAVEKTYDGTAAATLSVANYAVSGLISGDNVTIIRPTVGTYADKTAGTGKTVTVQGIGVTGSDAGNYNLAISNSANIGILDKATIRVSLTGEVAKYFDGTTAATVAPSNYQVSGIFSSDSVTLVKPTTGVFADALTGTLKPVTVTGIAISGADAGNYLVASSVTGNVGSIRVDPASIVQAPANAGFGGSGGAGGTAGSGGSGGSGGAGGAGGADNSGGTGGADGSGDPGSTAPGLLLSTGVPFTMTRVIDPTQTELKADDQRKQKSAGSPVTQSGNGDQLSGNGNPGSDR